MKLNNCNKSFSPVFLTSPNSIAVKIAEKIHENCNEACLFMVSKLKLKIVACFQPSIFRQGAGYLCICIVLEKMHRTLLLNGEKRYKPANYNTCIVADNSWTHTHRHAALGAIPWPWHWCTSTRRTAVVVGPQALCLGVFTCVCTLAPRLTAYQAVPTRSRIYFHQQ